MTQLTTIVIGLSADCLWSFSRSIRTQEDVPIRINIVYSHHAWVWVRKKLASFPNIKFHIHNILIDLAYNTLVVLRAIQGIGAAAVLPASVSHLYTPCTTRTYNGFSSLDRNSCTCISAKWPRPFHRVRNFCSRRTDWRCVWHHFWRITRSVLRV